MSGTDHSRNAPNGSSGAAGSEADPAKELWADLFLERLSPAAKAGLTAMQLEEIRRVAREVAPGPHRLDWRFSLPLLGPLFGGRRIYGVFLAGADRRGLSRRQQERVMRRRLRATGQKANAQMLAVGVSLTLLFVMVLVGALHAG
jgi:hypothetical protein